MGDKGGVKIDAAVFKERLQKFYASWKENANGVWGEAKAVSISAGPASDDLRYLKSVALHVWLFGYELPDTLMVFAEGAMHIFTSEKKAKLMEGLKEPAKEAGVELKVYPKAKGEDGSAQLKEILAVVEGLGAAPVTVSKLIKEKAEGALMTKWEALIKEAEEGGKVASADAAGGVATLFAAKDAAETLSLKKASHLSAQVLKVYVVPEIEGIIDEEKKVAHEKLSEKTEAVILEPMKANVKLKADNVDICYQPIFQSGGVYDLRPSAQCTKDPLKYDVIIVSLGSRYTNYCSNITRTFLVDPSKVKQAAYRALLAAQAAAIDALRPGAKLSAVYEAAAASLKASEIPELAEHLTKNVGAGIGLEFRESALLIGPKNDAEVRAGMAFNVSVGLGNLQDPDAAETKTYALQLADVAMVGAEGGAEILTKACSKEWSDVAYFFAEEGGAEEKPKVKAEDGKATGKTKVLDSHLRSEEQGATAEEKRRLKQMELEKIKNADTLRRLTEANKKKDAEIGGVRKAKDFTSYKDPSSMPAVRDLQIHVDDRAETVMLPIYGVLVPFHVATIKGVTTTQDGNSAFIRVNFNVPGATFGSGYAPVEKYPDMTFVKEVSFRSSDVRHAKKVEQDIKALRRHVQQRESERQERASLVTQEKLQTSKGRVYRLPDLWIRPSAGGRGRKISGTLECHANGFRYSTPRDENVDVIFANIKHAFFQPADNEMITLVHFHLHHPIMVGKKKTLDVQFYAEVMDVVQSLDGGRRSMYDPDEIEEEQRERDRRNKVNGEFQQFVRRVQELWERDFGQLELEFDIPFRELGFHGVPHKSSAFVIPTVNCLVELVEMPFTTITLADIEVVNLERVAGLSLKNFDMAIVFKDFTKDVHRIDAIPTSSLETIKEWLTSMKIKYYESRVNLMWKPILKTIMDDPEKFVEDGGWNFLDMEGGSDAEESEEESEGFVPDADEESSSSEEESESDEESVVESDEEDSDEDGSGSDEDGLSWEELEKEAKRADQEAEEGDSDDDRGKKRKGGSKGPPSKKGRR